MLESFSAELNFFDLHSLENTPDDGEDGESNNDPVGVGGADKALGDPTIVFFATVVSLAISGECYLSISGGQISDACAGGSEDATLDFSACSGQFLSLGTDF